MNVRWKRAVLINDYLHEVDFVLWVYDEPLIVSRALSWRDITT